MPEKEWAEWGVHVLEELVRGAADRKEIKKDVAEIKERMIRLEERARAKSVLWGALGAIIPGTIAVVVAVLT